MSDETLTAPVETGEATEKTTPDSSTGTESVASETTEHAGESQDRAEGGSVDASAPREQFTRRRKIDTIVELRQKLRDQSQRYGSDIEALRAEIAELRGGLANGGGEKKPRKTFWEAPEDVLEERISTHMSELRKGIIEHFEQQKEADQQSAEWKQETSEAAKFIKSQQGLTDDDIEDLKELIRETPLMKSMRPMERAEYAMFLWQKHRGITDKSPIKAKAASVTGSVGQPTTGPKVWTNADVEAEMKRQGWIGDPGRWSDEKRAAFKTFDAEIQKAQAEGRVK